MKSGIYQILNTVNNKRYIGSSARIVYRFYMHKCKLKQNYHANKKLQNAYNKHGKENFVYSILEFCEENKLIEKEQKYLDFFGMENLYNLLPNAYSPKGYKHSEKYKIVRRAFRHTPEAIEKIRISATGRKQPPKTDRQKELSSLAMKGRRLSPETEFKKGLVPWNEGLKGVQPWMKLEGLEKGRGLFKGTKGVLKANSGSFKKGSIPWNKKVSL